MMRIDIVDINIADALLQQLSLIYNDAAAFVSYAETTHIVVLYDSNTVVGGALIRVKPNLVIVKRMCSSASEQSVSIVQFLKEKYRGTEVHLNVPCDTVDVYIGLDFKVKYRSVRCMCVNRKNISHLAWFAKTPTPLVAAIKRGNIISMLNLNLKLSPNPNAFYCR